MGKGYVDALNNFGIKAHLPRTLDVRGGRDTHTGILKVVATGGLTGTTVFQCSYLAGYGDDWFNGCVVYFVGNNAVASNLTRWERRLVTDSTDAGYLTCAAWSGALKVGDEFLLVPPMIDSVNSPGGEFAVTKTVTPTTAGVAVTAASTGGKILLKSVSIQKITPNEANAVAALFVVTDDSVPLNQEITNKTGGTLTQAQDALITGKRYTEPLNFIMNTGKVLKIKTVTANAATTYMVHLSYVPLDLTATLTAA